MKKLWTENREGVVTLSVSIYDVIEGRANAVAGRLSERTCGRAATGAVASEPGAADGTPAAMQGEQDGPQQQGDVASVTKRGFSGDARAG